MGNQACCAQEGPASSTALAADDEGPGAVPILDEKLGSEALPAASAPRDAAPTGSASSDEKAAPVASKEAKKEAAALEKLKDGDGEAGEKAKGAKAKGAEEVEERRVADDGCAYTRAEFGRHFAADASRCWAKAKPLGGSPTTDADVLPAASAKAATEKKAATGKKASAKKKAAAKQAPSTGSSAKGDAPAADPASRASSPGPGRGGSEEKKKSGTGAAVAGATAGAAATDAGSAGRGRGRGRGRGAAAGKASEPEEPKAPAKPVHLAGDFELAPKFGRGREEKILPETMRAQCGGCYAIHTVQPNADGLQTQFTCPVCKSVNQMATTLKIMCEECEKIVMVQPTQEGELGFQCPHCDHNNRLSYHVLPSHLQNVTYPQSWNKRPKMGELDFVDVSGKQLELFQELLDRTWKDVTTRDRKYQNPPRLKLESVQQNCNPKLWRNYSLARKSIALAKGVTEQHEAKTTKVMQDIDVKMSLQHAVNEFFLFHGTKVSACESICKADFMVKLAGSHAGTLYGSGLYFGENSSKSDEYCHDDGNGIFAMLLCRVTCGKVLYSDTVKVDVDALMKKRKTQGCDSVLGDREKCRGTYREFIVFDNDLAYPAYILKYRRIPTTPEAKSK